MATRATNTMVEGLQKLAQDITALKFTPDADLELLIGLETTILTALKDRMSPSAVPPPPGNAMEMGAGAALEGVGAGMMAQGAAGGPAGLPGPGGPMPPMPGVKFQPDAMRRAFAGGGVQGG